MRLLLHRTLERLRNYRRRHLACSLGCLLPLADYNFTCFFHTFFQVFAHFNLNSMHVMVILFHVRRLLLQWRFFLSLEFMPGFVNSFFLYKKCLIFTLMFPVAIVSHLLREPCEYKVST